MPCRHLMLAATAWLLVCGTIASAQPPQMVDGARRDALASGLSGRPTPEALQRLEMLANQGDGDAALALGFALARGRGITQDLPAAFIWYLGAVRDGRQDAMPDAIKVWQAMSGARQQDAERLLRRRFSQDDIALLKGIWRDTAAAIAASQDEARRRAAKEGGG